MKFNGAARVKREVVRPVTQSISPDEPNNRHCNAMASVSSGTESMRSVAVLNGASRDKNSSQSKNIAQLLLAIRGCLSAKRIARHCGCLPRRRTKRVSRLATGPVGHPFHWYSPADVRVFAPLMLDMVMRGKYQCKLARLTERVVQNGERLLDLGSGVDFLSVYACKLHEVTHFLAQEDNASRRVIADSILKRNALDFGGRFEQSNEWVIFKNDA